MKLLTQAIRKALPPLYSTEGEGEKVVYAKYFNPTGGQTWYVLEGEPALDDDGKEGDYYFYTWMTQVGMESEFGLLSLNELASVRGQFGLPMERDLYFEPKPLAEVMASYERGMVG